MTLKPLTSVCLPLKGKVKRIDALTFMPLGAVVETVSIKNKLSLFGNINKKYYIWSTISLVTIYKVENDEKRQPVPCMRLT